MMSKRMNIATPRPKKDGGSYWVNIGTAWFNDNGGIQLVFDALPIPDAEGRCVANLFEPREREQGGGGTAPRTAARAFETNLEDDVPFVSCDPSLEHRVG
jgi:hypothetical protein